MSGIAIEGSLSGVSVETGSLQSIVKGGLSYFTTKQKAAQDANPTFPLYASKNDAGAIIPEIPASSPTNAYIPAPIVVPRPYKIIWGKFKLRRSFVSVEELSIN